MFEEKKIRDLLLDEEKVEDLVRKYYSDIYKYCFFHLGNKETAQDITQDVFLKFLKSLDTYREYGKLKNYLYVVAKNTIKDFFRKRYETIDELETEISCDGGLDNVPLQIDIWREIQQLDPLDKELIILRYYQDLKVKDIAQIVNMPPSTVGYKIKRIEKLLKIRLGEARVISVSSPIEGAITVEPTLEDLYLKIFSDEIQEEGECI